MRTPSSTDLILLTVFLFIGLAPFAPQPHVVEKLVMLSHGTLHRPIDIFDLCYHGLALILFALKVMRILTATEKTR